MKITTVRGDIAPADLGITLPHEHLLCDVSCRARATTDPYLQSLVDKEVDCTIIGDLRRNPLISRDSLRLTDVNTAIEELNYFKEAGGQSLVDQTNVAVGGSPALMRRIAEATGIQIIAGSGYYSPMLPENIAEMPVEQMADNMVREIDEGFEGTTIRAGLIGEIGTSWPLTPDEIRILRAAARAQVRTGAALSIHPSPWDTFALDILDIVESEGADLSRVVICHLDHVLDVEYHKAIARRGAYVEYDRFGVEWYRSLAYSLQVFPRDLERVAALLELMHAGFLSQILISHDVCQKVEIKKYGGHGYAHILRYVVPMMQKMGVSSGEIHTLLVDNPRRMLAF